MRSFAIRLVFALVVLGMGVGAACYSHLPPPPAPEKGQYLIGPPDTLDITILPDPAIEQQVTVRPDGKVSIDLIGDVQVEGRTPAEIAKEIEQRIARYKRSASVNVGVSQARTNSVIIYREDGRGSTVELNKVTRIAEAIASSGGVSASLSRSAKIRVIRTNGTETEVIRVNLAAIRGGNLTTNIVVQGGDIVVVPPTFLARIGFMIQAVTFPLTGLTGAVGSALGAAALVM